MITAISLPLLLMIASYSDIKKRIIPNSICGLICLCALPYITVINFLGIMIALPLLLIGVLSDGIGGGDIKLTGALGFALGCQDVLVMLVTGLFMMLLYHAVLTFIIKWNHETVCTAYPMAPFMGVGYCVLLLTRIV